MIKLSNLFSRRRQGIFIDFKNKEQVKWWNETGRKLVRVVYKVPLIETSTDKVVGAFLSIKGFKVNDVVKKNDEFLSKNGAKKLVNVVIDY